ncbi:hypothetical protein VB776_21820 [Arcicella sp. DC2W]|uniref:Penicillin-binding protein n=1 Tax=Arcicella gelida TaxID=2984195 RepID=A0ABU5SAU9_9BACT|nr:hypothetical protein [Arcicella sp. DC2W]MEA5405593.1 hypothetical protein [Arcicella sp. DC2W]
MEKAYKPFFVLKGDALEKQLYSSFNIFFCLLFIIIIFLYIFISKNKNTKEYDYYQTTGYVNKVNAFLDKYISDYNSCSIDNQGRLTINNSSEEGGLIFYIGYEISSIRVTGIRKFKSSEDSLFYYASNLEKHFKLQRENLEREIFKVDIEPSTDAGSDFKIKNIFIDKHIINTPIPANPDIWEGNIIVNQPSALDSVLFLKVGNSWIPLEIQSRNHNEYSNIITYSIDSLYQYSQNQQQNTLNTFFKNLYRLHVINLVHIDNLSNLNVKLFRDGNNSKLHIDAILNNGFNINIHTQKKTMTFDSDQIASDVILKNDDFPCEINYVLNNISYNYTLTDESPFKKLSFVVNSTKGKQRYISETGDFYTQQMLKQIVANQNKNIHTINKDSNVFISQNAVMAQSLETKLKTFSTSGAVNPNTPINKEMTIRLGMTVLNTSNGEILGAPFYENTESYQKRLGEVKNFNLINHTIGSTFKPILTAAILDQDHRLYDYNLSINDFSGPEIAGKRYVNRILGYDLEKEFNLGSGFFGNNIGMRDYIRWSNDAYPVALFIKSVEGDRILHRDRIIPKTLINSFLGTQLAKNIEKNYSISVSRYDTCTYDYRCWLKNPDINVNNKNYKDSLQIFSLISPEMISLRGDLIGSNNRNSFRGEMIPWILGSGSNWWNNVKMAEAYCRLITNKKVFANFNVKKMSFSSIPHHDLNNLQVKGKFISDMSTNISSGGIWVSNLTNVLQDSLVIIAKTGTPQHLEGIQERVRASDYLDNRQVDQGILAFTIMTKNQFRSLMRYYETGSSSDLPVNLGITCYLSIHITHNYRNKDVTNSEHAINFIDKEVLNNLVNYNKHLFK